jgi:tetratricopeptide (TPR) repeat protein
MLPRQKTLYALIRWGYDLLTAHEQLALQRLSTLVGSWNMEAAAAIVGGDEIPAQSVFEIVTSLIDKSLILAEPHGDETRYSSLESTRAFALDELEASGRQQEAARAHARYFARLVTDALDAQQRNDAAAFATIRREYANVTVALQWTLSGPGDFDLGLGLVQSLWDFWQGSGRYREAQRWLERVLDREDDEERSRPFAVWLAKATMNLGDARNALAYALPLIARCADANDGQGLHLARRMAASAYFEMNDLVAARAQIEAMLAEPCVRTDERALTLGYLAYIDMSDGKIESAQRLLAEAVQLDVPSSLQSWLHEYYGIALFLGGNTDEAIEYARKCLAYEEGVHNSTRGALASLTLAWCWLATAEYDRARVALRRAVREPTLTTRPDYLCACFEAFALFNVEQGEAVRAATLLGFARAERKRRGVRAPYERILSMLKQAEKSIESAIGLVAFDAAVKRGGWLSLDAATNEALST